MFLAPDCTQYTASTQETAQPLARGVAAALWTAVWIEVDHSLSGARVARVLEQLRICGRHPALIQVDNGPEFTSRALDEWAHRHGVALQFIRPGKPVENAFIESFNGRIREECLNQSLFGALNPNFRLSRMAAGFA